MVVRNVLGSVIAAIGAAAAVWSPFSAWYDGREGRDFGLSDLFSASGITGHHPELFASLFLSFLAAAVITLAGIVLRSRLLVAGAGVVVLAFTLLWMVREGQAEGSLAVDSSGNGLGLGVARAVGGGLFLLLGALVMRGRRGPGRHSKAYGVPREPYERHGQGRPADEPEDGEYGPEPPPWQQPRRPPPGEDERE
ncbi:hypothetical protein [Streptomyces odontomachi]|uniref:hypothetical protein n=1 Tax=Streptomyces odontomachi TaxID=2944940 RepID=UPI00272E5436|nr:hypothetical protein [Streptomyces sp. ODS25]